MHVSHGKARIVTLGLSGAFAAEPICVSVLVKLVSRLPVFRLDRFVPSASCRVLWRMRWIWLLE